MKTIREWLTELPEPYRTEALENMEKSVPCEGDRLVSKKSEAIDIAFLWPNTPQGNQYWECLFEGAQLDERPKEATPPDLHALLKEILAEQTGIYTALRHEVVYVEHIKAVFKKHGVEIEQPF